MWFSVLFPMIAGLVACGGSVTGVEGASSGGSSSGGLALFEAVSAAA